jgi:hypothetical protein
VRPQGAGAEVRVVNPNPSPGLTGILAPVGKVQAWLADSLVPTDFIRPGLVHVAFTPSFRPGLEYDLSSYPADWVKPID